MLQQHPPRHWPAEEVSHRSPNGESDRRSRHALSSPPRPCAPRSRASASPPPAAASPRRTRRCRWCRPASASSSRATDGEVTAHIQIQYAGDAGEFGWLLPLPSVPDAGARHRRAVHPAHQPPPSRKYQPAARVFDGNCARRRPLAGSVGGAARGGAAASAAGGRRPATARWWSRTPSAPTTTPCSRPTTRTRCSTGSTTTATSCPPAPTTPSAPYIRPGAFFLALKLRAGAVGRRPAAGGAALRVRPADDPDHPDLASRRSPTWASRCGCSARAAPSRATTATPSSTTRGSTGSAPAQNYNDVIIARRQRGPERHTFVTEYAGASRGDEGRARRAGPLRQPRPAANNPRCHRVRRRAEGVELPAGPALRAMDLVARAARRAAAPPADPGRVR